MSLPVAFEASVVPSGLRKSSSGSSFHVPKRPFVYPLNTSGAAKTMERDSCTSVTVTDIPDGNVARNELFCGRDTATEPFKLTAVLVKLSKS